MRRSGAACSGAALVCVALAVLAAAAAAPAAASGACDVTSGGTTYYLSSLTSSADYQAPHNEYTYFINVCQNVAQSCGGQNVAVCQVKNADQTQRFNTGVMPPSFGTPSGSPNQIVMTYGNGSPDGGCPQARQSIITFICNMNAPNNGVGAPVWTQEQPTCVYHFDWQTKYACAGIGPTPPGPGPLPPGYVSGGWIFVILYLVGFVVYCIVGILIKRFKMGASGCDLMPNFDFWKDLPRKVLDGFKFVGSKTCCRRSGYSETV